MTVSISDVDIPASGEVTQSIGDDNDQDVKDGALPKTESLELSASDAMSAEERKTGEKEEKKEIEERKEGKQEEVKEVKEEKEGKKEVKKESKKTPPLEAEEKKGKEKSKEKKEKVAKKAVEQPEKKESKPQPTATYSSSSSSSSSPLKPTSAPTSTSTSQLKPKSKSKPKSKPKLAHILSSTMLSEADRDVLVGLVSSLGDAKFVSRYSRSVNLLVAGQNVRSVKMMCAVARGIPVVTPAWLYACLEQGKWVDPDSFISSFAEEGLKKRRKMESGILAKQGPFFVAKNTQPPRNELIEIIQCCDGSVTEDLDECEFVIGKVEGREYVKETFVLDGVMKGELPRISEYIVKEEEESDEFYWCLLTNRKSDRSCQNRVQLVAVSIHLHFRLVDQVYKGLMTAGTYSLLLLFAVQGVVARGANEVILFNTNGAGVTKEVVLCLKSPIFLQHCCKENETCANEAFFWFHRTGRYFFLYWSNADAKFRLQLPPRARFQSCCHLRHQITIAFIVQRRVVPSVTLKTETKRILLQRLQDRHLSRTLERQTERTLNRTGGEEE